MTDLIKDPEALKTIQIIINLSPFIIPAVIIALVLKKGFNILARYSLFWIIFYSIFTAMRFYLYQMGEVSLKQFIYDVIVLMVLVLIIVIKRRD